MGLFDDIRCEFPLPLPDDQGELAGKDWTKEGFQTKDLGQGMGQYCIRRDGTLWLIGARWLRDDPFEEAHQATFFGTVEFYDCVCAKKSDYSVRWKATFADGKLGDLRLIEWQPEDNSQRLQQEAERSAQQAKTERFRKTLVGRFVYPPYAFTVGMILALAAGSAYRFSRAFDRLRMFCFRLCGRLMPYGDPIGARRRQRKLEELNRQALANRK